MLVLVLIGCDNNHYSFQIDVKKIDYILVVVVAVQQLSCVNCNPAIVECTHTELY